MTGELLQVLLQASHRKEDKDYIMSEIKPPPTKKKLPVGIEFFDEMIENNYYYIDKTNLIAEILDEASKVTLFTRPRRFGKTLNMTMLRSFFEIGRDKSLFNGLAISRRSDLCHQYMGKFPVVFLTLKGVDGLNFESAYGMLCGLIQDEARRLRFLETSDALKQDEKEEFAQLLGGTRDFDYMKKSINTLCTLLEKHFGSKVVLLIDEYDVPLDKAYINGYYNEMIDVIRAMFGAALKSNDSLQFAVLTGCLRVSKESIFTGLNNLEVNTVSHEDFTENFGFTENEVHTLFANYGLENHLENARAWYDGYLFGNTEIYCPWDVINYCKSLTKNPNARARSYWINSSGNDIVHRLIKNARGASVQSEIETLIEGGTINKKINENITHSEIDKNIENIWSLLYMTGYLTTTKMPDSDIYTLRIPNLEITKIYKQQVLEWFQECVRDEAQTENETLETLYAALERGDAPAIEQLLNDRLLTTVSYFDAHENFYHGFLLALLSTCDIWIVHSNMESGMGRADIFVENARGTVGIVIEIKNVRDPDKLENACVAAMTQINEKDYMANFKRKRFERVLKMGIAFCGKECKVLVEEG